MGISFYQMESERTSMQGEKASESARLLGAMGTANLALLAGSPPPGRLAPWCRDGENLPPKCAGADRKQSPSHLQELTSLRRGQEGSADSPNFRAF